MTDLYKALALAALLMLWAAQPAQAQQSQADESQADETSAEAAPVGEGAPMASEEDELAAEDAAVDDVLSEAELIYRDEGDFIPSEQVSADQSLDYPIDI